MTIIRKTSAGKVAGSLSYVLSDATLDRYGDIIDPAGWELKWFKKNPIALFNHMSSMPIGNWKNVRVEDNKLIAELELAALGTSARIDEIVRLIEQGILRATSVGFRSLQVEPINEKDPYGGQRYTKQELLETSVVSVPANPAALQLAKSLNVSDETISLVFGENAETRRREITGKKADYKSESKSRVEASRKFKDIGIMTLAQRIIEAQEAVTAKRDKLVELTQVDDLDTDAIEELNADIDKAERGLAALEASEAKIGANATRTPASPAIIRRPLGIQGKQVGGLDLLVRRAVVFGLSAFTGRSVDAVLDERYPGHEATAAVVKAAADLGTTTGSHFVDDLQQTSYQGFVDALDGVSIYPKLRAGGMGISFDAAGTAYIPGVAAAGANGSFFSEGSPIRVGRITTNSTTMTPRKAGVIVPFSREAAKRSTPNLETLVRRRIVADTAAILDSHLLDAVAEDSTRPGGLLNGVSAVATGYGGDDYKAVIEDINALVAPFDTANASNGIALIMHPTQRRKLAMTPGPDGTFGWADKFLSEFTVISSTYATAGRLVAVRMEDLATAMGDTPEFEVSNSATVHMEDTTPVAIGTVGTPNVVAAPTRSFFQTDSIGIRMIMDVNWKMLRSGMVQWIDGTNW